MIKCPVCKTEFRVLIRVIRTGERLCPDCLEKAPGMTTEQLAEAAIKTIEKMTSIQKAKLRRELCLKLRPLKQRLYQRVQ